MASLNLMVSNCIIGDRRKLKPSMITHRGLRPSLRPFSHILSPQDQVKPNFSFNNIFKSKVDAPNVPIQPLTSKGYAVVCPQNVAFSTEKISESGQNLKIGPTKLAQPMVPDTPENPPSPAKLQVKIPRKPRKSQKTAQPKPYRSKSMRDYFSAANGPIGEQERDGSRS